MVLDLHSLICGLGQTDFRRLPIPLNQRVEKSPFQISANRLVMTPRGAPEAYFGTYSQYSCPIYNRLEVAIDVIFGVVVEEVGLDLCEFGDSKSNRSSVMRPSQFVMETNDYNRNGVNGNGRKRLKNWNDFDALCKQIRAHT